MKSEPAFPLPKYDASKHCDGMSLRDWFAGQALANIADRTVSARLIAQSAYELADAMLAARKKGGAE